MVPPREPPVQGCPQPRHSLAPITKAGWRFVYTLPLQFWHQTGNRTKPGALGPSCQHGTWQATGFSTSQSAEQGILE